MLGHFVSVGVVYGATPRRRDGYLGRAAGHLRAERGRGTLRPGYRAALEPGGLEMNTGEERVLSELQSALDALAKASEHLENASQESTASGASRKVAGAKVLLAELQQEVAYLMRLTRSEG